MAIDLSLYDWKDEVLNGDPRYTIQDENGQIIEDDVQITLKTPALQTGTPMNKKTFQEFEDTLWKVGEIKLFGTTIDKDNTELCDGKYLKDTDFPELKNAIGSEKGFSIEESNISQFSGDKKIAYGKGIFVGSSGISPVGYSSDAKNWSVGTRSEGTMSFGDVVYNPTDNFFYASSGANNLASNYTRGGMYRSSNGIDFVPYKVWTGDYDARCLCVSASGEVWCAGEDGYMATKSGGAFKNGGIEAYECETIGDLYFYKAATGAVTSVQYFTGVPTQTARSSTLYVDSMRRFRKANGILFGLGGFSLINITRTPIAITLFTYDDPVTDITWDGTHYYVLTADGSTSYNIYKYTASWSLVDTFNITEITGIVPYANNSGALLSDGAGKVYLCPYSSGNTNIVLELNDLIYLPEYDISKRQYAYIKTKSQEEEG